MAEINRPRIPINVLDNQAPTAGSRDIKVSNVTSNSLTISWEKASDNVTAVNNIRYQVGLTDLDNPNDGWHIVVRDEKGICSHTFTDLKPKTTYGFYVEAYDESGNVLSYPDDNGCMSAKTVDSQANPIAPQVPNVIKLSFSIEQNARVLQGTNSIECIMDFPFIKRSNGKIVMEGTQSWNYRWSNQKPTSDVIQLPEGCSLKNNELMLTLRSRISAISSWKTCCKGNIDVSGDTLKIKIVGSYLDYSLRLGGTANEGYAQFKNTPAGSTGQTGQSSAGSTPQPTDAERRQKIRDYLRDQSSKDTLADVIVSTASTNKDTEYIVSGGQAMMLMNKKYDINNPCNEFMPIDEMSIYPGRLIYANKDLVDGKPSDVKFYVADEVGKVTVTVNFIAAGKSSSEHGVIATSSEIQNAIERILTRSFAAGSLPPASVNTNTYIKNSKESISVDAGCSVDYMGAKCKIDTTTTKSQDSFYKMEQFTQGFYQISVEPEDKDDVNYFGKGVTVDALRKAREKGPLAIIKSVTYGRVGYNVKKYDASSFTFKGDESGGYKEIVSVTSKQDIAKSSNASSHYARIWGGSATTAGNALLAGRSANNKPESDNLDKDFTAEMAKSMVVSMTNQGVPISFTVVFLASGRSVGTRLTGSYVESSYIPLVNRLSFSIEQDASVLSGTNSVRCAIQYDYIMLDNNGNVVKTLTDTWGYYEWSNKRGYSSVIELPKGCYFKNNEVFFRIQSRRSAVSDWKLCREGYLNITGGNLKVKLSGSYYDHDVHLAGDASEGYAQFR